MAGPPALTVQEIANAISEANHPPRSPGKRGSKRSRSETDILDYECGLGGEENLPLLRHWLYVLSVNGEISTVQTAAASQQLIRTINALSKTQVCRRLGAHYSMKDRQQRQLEDQRDVFVNFEQPRMQPTTVKQETKAEATRICQTLDGYSWDQLIVLAKQVGGLRGVPEQVPVHLLSKQGLCAHIAVTLGMDPTSIRTQMEDDIPSYCADPQVNPRMLAKMLESHKMYMTHALNDEEPATKASICAALQRQFKVAGPPLQVRQDTDESLGQECLSGILGKYFPDVYARTLDVHGEPNAVKLKAVLADFGLPTATGKNSMVLNCNRLEAFARSNLEPLRRPNRSRIAQEANARMGLFPRPQTEPHDNGSRSQRHLTSPSTGATRSRVRVHVDMAPTAAAAASSGAASVTKSTSSSSAFMHDM